MFRLVRGKASIWPMDDSLVVAVEALASDGIKGMSQLSFLLAGPFSTSDYGLGKKFGILISPILIINGVPHKPL